ncbi:putative strigolactone esterase DAD2 isoform X2 [Silene latifolia]|uniref:putative strigolactone esterase DAD2 isoform X2 n=1 Tax=Silene latifolia TaxID=37657 RepID=UPI003D776523
MGQNLIEALNVRVEGNGQNYLVLAHGFGTDQSAWQRILPYFTRSYKVILYDLPCAGSVNPDFFDFQRRRTLFSKLILIGASPRFLNDHDYHGGFEESEIETVFSAMEANYAAWVNGFAPLAVGADVPTAVQEFSRTLFNMRPDISLFACRTVFKCDFRGVLGLVKVPCFIIQTAKDMSVPESVATYMKDHLGGKSVVIMLNTEGHLPHLSAPGLLAQALWRALSQ